MGADPKGGTVDPPTSALAVEIDENGEASAAGRAAPVRHIRAWVVSSWRAPTWLLGGWCVVFGLWLAAQLAPLASCPYGQGCRRPPVLTWSPALAGWLAVGLGTAAALLVLWWWDRRRQRVAVPAIERRSRLRVLVPASLLGVLAAAHLLLFAPMVPKPFCATPVHINQWMAYPLNCDSSLFMSLARHPRQLLSYQNPRQSRPGYIALGAAATRVLGPALHALGVDRLYGQSDRAYLPLVLINLLVAAAAVAMLAWLLARLGSPPWVTVALCVLIAINDVTKAFFWTPHQQMFALLVPVLTIVLARWAILDRPSWRLVAVVGLGLGLASLVYGSFLITLAVLLLVLLARGWRGVGLCALLAGAFAVAPVGWIVLCRELSGSYYNQETAVYHEFVWLIEDARQGWHPLAAAVEMSSVSTMRVLIEVGAVPLVLLAALIALAVGAGLRLDPVTRQERATLIAAVLTVVSSVLFHWGIGIIAARIMYHAVPGILLLAGWVSARLSAKSRTLAAVNGVALVALAAVCVGWELASHGPYS